jgi:phosphoglycolate phosphatase
MIGDTCLDSISAKEANITAIGVTSGYGSKNDLLACSDIVLQDALEAIRFIKNQ